MPLQDEAHEDVGVGQRLRAREEPVLFAATLDFDLGKERLESDPLETPADELLAEAGRPHHGPITRRATSAEALQWACFVVLQVVGWRLE
jgi:hypothetical protein